MEYTGTKELTACSVLFSLYFASYASFFEQETVNEMDNISIPVFLHTES